MLMIISGCGYSNLNKVIQIYFYLIKSFLLILFVYRLVLLFLAKFRNNDFEPELIISNCCLKGPVLPRTKRRACCFKWPYLRYYSSKIQKRIHL